MITPALRWNAAAGVEGIRILLDERKLRPGKDIEAVAFISDNPAIGAFNELIHRKIQIPKQLAITGYNATPKALCTTSPITNVRMPFNEQGSIAVNLLLKLLKNEEIPMKTILPAKMLVAQSCGCQSPVIKNAAANIETTSHKEDKIILISKTHKDSSKIMSKKAITEDIIADLKEYAQNNKISGPVLAEYSEILLKALFDEIENNRQGEFLLRFDEFVRKLINVNEFVRKQINIEKEIEFLQDIISIFRRKLIIYAKKTHAIHMVDNLWLDNLWSQARVMIAEASSRAKKNESLIKIKQEETLRDISVKLLSNYNMNILMDILVESLPRLDIPGCYLSLYENAAGIKSLFDVPENARLILAYENGIRKELNAEGILYPSKDLLPKGFSTNSKQKAMVVSGGILLFFNYQGNQRGSLRGLLDYLVKLLK